PHIIFLSDYDMLVSGQLVAGVDVWINTPRRPWEACGTSGMKVLVNGGINLSELDGWWQEAYTPDVGWAIGDGKEHGEDPNWDAKEADTLYTILETEVIPQFYTRDATGIPRKWVEKMRASMSKLTPRFSANRAVCEYTQNYYIPGAQNFKNRAAALCAKSKEQLSWQHTIAEHWDKIRFVDSEAQLQNDQYLFEVQLYLDDLDPQYVEVQLYADGLEGGPPFCQAMTLAQQSAGSPGVYLYTGGAPSSRPESHYTPRVIPHFPGAVVPLEDTHILWH
ncbi:MAG: alpha-glucan family phosphorylase, partial [Verrucomicrobia bacterium]|nr:alpha-glucan family phosphorylase [Verrucomicrobiota bacterium]